MAISFVGSYVATHAATTAQTVAFSNLRDSSNATPTLAQNDIVFVAVENASTIQRAAGALVPSTYTASGAADYQNDTNDSNFQVSYKVMGATPDTSVAIPASNATTAGVGYAIYVFRGVDTTNPFDATTVVTGNINTGVANAAAITPTTAGAWVVAFAGAAVAAGAVFTNPANMSATTNHFRSATITTTTNDANIGGAIYTAWTSGAFDPAAFGGSTSTNTGSWSAVTIALKNFVPAVNYTLDGNGTPGNYALTGGTANVSYGAKLVANAGSYSLAGNTADLKVAATLAAEAGSYALTGDTANLTVAATLIADSGSYSLVGNTVDLAVTSGPVAASLIAESGTYSLTGISATLAIGYSFSAESGIYALAGNNALLSYTQVSTKKVPTGRRQRQEEEDQYSQDLEDLMDILKRSRVLSPTTVQALVKTPGKDLFVFKFQQESRNS